MKNRVIAVMTKKTPLLFMTCVRTRTRGNRGKGPKEGGVFLVKTAKTSELIHTGGL